MRKQDLQDEDIDRIGIELLNASKVSEAEIEKIVSHPNLYKSVNARIEDETLKKNSHFNEIDAIYPD